MEVSEKVVSLYRDCKNQREFIERFESNYLSHSRRVYKFLEQIEPKDKIKPENNQPNLF